MDVQSACEIDLVSYSFVFLFCAESIFKVGQNNISNSFFLFDDFWCFVFFHENDVKVKSMKIYMQKSEKTADIILKSD